MARKRGQPKPPGRRRLRELFSEHFQAAKARVASLSLRTPAEAASVAALCAVSGAYPDVGVLGTIGLGAIGSLWANYLTKSGRGEVRSEVPPELVEQFLAHDEGQRELVDFLEKYDLRSVVVAEFGEDALTQVKGAVGEALDEHGVATKGDVESLRETVIERVTPPAPRAGHHFPSPNPDFTGREEELRRLRDSLVEGGTAALTQAITGLGGVGKTQLAVEYAHRHRDDYEVIWWVRAEEPAQLADDFAALARALDLPEKDEQDQRVVIQAVCRWLEGNDGWLLVFDNAPKAESLQDYRPGGGRGHVIITSRDPDWAGVAKPLLVKVWPPDESLEFLGKRLGRRDEAAAELAEELGHLPLALAQAAAYIETSGISLEDYLKLYRERRTELWGDQPPPHDYSHTVTTTWDMAMKSLHKEEPAAAELLNLCAFLAPDDIPRDLLARAIDDPLVLNKAIAALRHYSLIAADDESLSVHRLVQAVTRDRLSDEERGRWAGAAVRLMDAAFPYDENDLATWGESARLLPHALTAAQHAVDARVDGVEPPRVLSDAGRYLAGRAELGQGRRVLERAVAAAERTFGADDPNVASCVNNLGRVLQEMGDVEGAKEHVERALGIDEKALGPDHPNVARDVNNLGMVLQEMGDLKGAKECFERALRIDEKAYGPDHATVAIRVNNLGRVLQEMGDLEGAKEQYERALGIFETGYGKEHPQVATAVSNLGLVLREMGDLEGAKQCFERALGIDEKAHGPDHPNVARDVNNLGLVLHGTGDLEGAKECFERALGIFEKTHGKEHPQVATATNNLGLVLQDMGDLAGAKERFERALGIDEKAYGPEHPEVAIDVNNLGGVLQAMGDLEGAKEHYERALAIDEKVYGSGHPRVARDVNNVGSVLFSSGDLAGALTYAGRALEMRERAYGPDHPDVARCVGNVGHVLAAMGKKDEARKRYERALAIFRRFLGEDHPHTKTVRGKLEGLGEGEGD